MNCAKVSLFLLMVLSLVIGLSTFVVAKEGNCNGGAKHGDPCTGTSQCPNACIGGSRDRLNCKSDKNCPGTCDADGIDGAKNCLENKDCVGKCYGGKNDGKSCRSYVTCPDGECKGDHSCQHKGSCDNKGSCRDSENNELLIQLASFSATRTSNGILLEWETKTEKESSGANLYCAKIKNDEFDEVVKINSSAPIPTKALIPFIGNTYSYSSAQHLDSGVYYCVLEEVDDYGKCSVHCDFVDAVVVSSNDVEQNVDLPKATKLCSQYNEVLKNSCIEDVLVTTK
ncbi:hypothetical protein THII_2561 [Thioploca ingrica]|uniref:Uncharacterized protein n=1 Tax=Thioploca ingrica TaxID=40754 RepID=A0A090AFH5_9GAMM|nr:hypothetical protein THII_2561 [Thioploca ingrica]